jgi:hypothetical protein
MYDVKYLEGKDVKGSIIPKSGHKMSGSHGGGYLQCDFLDVTA